MSFRLVVKSRSTPLGIKISRFINFFRRRLTNVFYNDLRRTIGKTECIFRMIKYIT